MTSFTCGIWAQLIQFWWYIYIYIYRHPVVSMHAWLSFGLMSWIIPKVALHSSLLWSFVFICVFMGSVSQHVSLRRLHCPNDCPDQWSWSTQPFTCSVEYALGKTNRLPEIFQFTLYFLFQLCVLEDLNENANKLWYSVQKRGRGHYSDNLCINGMWE